MITTSINIYDKFTEHSSAERVGTELVILDTLRQAYPDCDIRHINTSNCDLLGFASAGHARAEFVADGDEHVTQHVYQAPKRRMESSPGSLEPKIAFGKFNYTYTAKDTVTFPLHKVEWFAPGTGSFSFFYIPIPRSDSQVTPDFIDNLLIEAGRWSQELHDEIYVFDCGRWMKSKALFNSIQSSSWDDVVVNPKTKADLIADVEGFYDNGPLYAEYNVPWKRGMIFHGPPGNGKTTSIKAIMAALAARPDPIPSLYVKSLEASQGREPSIRAIFQRARASAPCLLVFEDLDSLVTDKIRSYFLNEVDGLESNEGILMIGSSNHLNKLDPSVSKRPSRFDRKYHFKAPALAERELYAHYWGRKLAERKKVEWDDGAAIAVSELTDGFSYAYLKELFLTSLFLFASGNMDKRRAAESDSELKKQEGETLSALGAVVQLPENKLLRIMVAQIKALREEMESANESEVNPTKA